MALLSMSPSPSLSPSCRPDRSLSRPIDTGSFPASILRAKIHLNSTKRVPLVPCIKCENTDKNKRSPEQISVDRYPYDSYMDSTSGMMEPASGARARIPGPELWPEGTASRVRADAAPPPTGVSSGASSYGKTPGSRRMRNKSSVAAAESIEKSMISDDAAESTEMSTTSDDAAKVETLHDGSEPKEESSEFVVYQEEPQTEELTDYELDKKLGRPHPFVNPHTKKSIGEPLTSEELWWNWRKPDQEQWSRWQKRRPDVETVFLKAMAETGQIKLYGDHPTMTECSLYRARRHLYKEERLEAEHERLEREGPLAYYSEWVSAWKRDTSREAVQKHFEETGEDENTQLIEMFTYQTDREYRIMMGTDVRIRRDPLAMRMREDQIKQIWGGDPVYPTINYIRDPDEVIDFRGPDFHEPTPSMLDYLKEHGKLITQEELNELLEQEKDQELEVIDVDDAMAQAVDIGEFDDEFTDGDAEGEEEKATRNWNTPEHNKSKGKPKNNLSLEEAIEDSENLTDFLLDFDEDDDF